MILNKLLAYGRTFARAKYERVPDILRLLVKRPANQTLQRESWGAFLGCKTGCSPKYLEGVFSEVLHPGYHCVRPTGWQGYNQVGDLVNALPQHLTLVFDGT